MHLCYDHYSNQKDTYEQSGRIIMDADSGTTRANKIPTATSDMECGTVYLYYIATILSEMVLAAIGSL